MELDLDLNVFFAVWIWIWFGFECDWFGFGIGFECGWFGIGFEWNDLELNAKICNWISRAVNLSIKKLHMNTSSGVCHVWLGQ